MRPASITPLVCLLAVSFAATLRAADSAPLFPSPNGLFSLKLTEPASADTMEMDAAIVERATGRAVGELSGVYTEHRNEIHLLWSSDSRFAAFGSRGQKQGDTQILFWNGAKFEDVKLPVTPDPMKNFRKLAHGREPNIRIYSDFVTPVRWLKDDELLMSEEILTRDQSYVSKIDFTVRLDKEHHASFGRVVKEQAYVQH